jgi:hypothetical protein
MADEEEPGPSGIDGGADRRTGSGKGSRKSGTESDEDSGEKGSGGEKCPAE